MGKTISITLEDHFADLIERQVDQGHHGDAADVICAGLGLLEEQEMKLTALRAALIEGEQSGASKPFDVEAFIRGKRGAKLLEA